MAFCNMVTFIKVRYVFIIRFEKALMANPKGLFRADQRLTCSELQCSRSKVVLILLFSEFTAFRIRALRC